MNQLTINYINRIANFMATIDESFKQTPLRLVNIGYDLFKDSGLKAYRCMTVGQFLATVAGYNNISRRLQHIVDALIANPPLPVQPQTKAETNLVSEAMPIKTLPANPDKPFFSQIAGVIDTLLTAMSTLNDYNKESAERLSLSFNKGISYSEIGVATDVSRERVRKVCEEFMSALMKGKIQKELAGELYVSPSFIEEAHRVAASIENQTIDSVKANFGEIEDSRFQFIIKGMGLRILVVDNKAFLVKKNNYNRFSSLVDKIHMSLSKEFDFVSVASLIEDNDEGAIAFIETYLSSQVETFEVNEDKKSVRMIGEGLGKIVRIARIIFEAAGWIDKADIAKLYKEQYEGNVPTMNSERLRSMGFTPQEKTGKWKFGEAPAKIRDIIRQIITPERPLATFKTIMSAAVKSGLDYPQSTIRAYITDIATPENKQNDLFCLKGYCHLYPNYSWRSYTKAA